MPTSLASTGDCWGAGLTLSRAGEPGIGGRGRGLGRPPEPRPRPEGWQPLTVHGQSRSGSPRKGGRTGSSGGVDRTDQLCGAATSGSPPPLPAAALLARGRRPGPRAEALPWRQRGRREVAASVSHSGCAPAEGRVPGGAGGAAGSPMGLSGSKHKPHKGKGKGPPGAPRGVRTREGLGLLGVPPLQIRTTRESSVTTAPQEPFIHGNIHV